MTFTESFDTSAPLVTDDDLQELKNHLGTEQMDEGGPTNEQIFHELAGNTQITRFYTKFYGRQSSEEHGEKYEAYFLVPYGDAEALVSVEKLNTISYEDALPTPHTTYPIHIFGEDKMSSVERDAIKNNLYAYAGEFMRKHKYIVKNPASGIEVDSECRVHEVPKN